MAVIFILGQINPLLDYFKSKVTAKRRFENDAFRQVNHVFIAIIFAIGAVWLFTTYTDGNPLWLNIFLALTGIVMLILSLITFFVYINYLLHHRISFLIYNSDENSLVINGERIYRNEIQEIKWHRVGNKRLFIIWSSFEYLEIFLSNGNRIIVSSLILRPKSLNKYLSGLHVTILESNFPIISKF